VTTSEVTAPPVLAERTLGSPYPFLTGLAVLMVSWILLVPPFGGIDEFDHAYKAAATARGEWAPTPSQATRGTGAWLEVPRDIVEAARPQCQLLDYTTASDCVGTVHGDTVRVASGAGRYHPLFYAVVGTVALPFDGTAALYVMRLATAALALALVALALSALRTWARSRVALLGPVVACTPVVVYSCSIMSPNGVEMAAGLAFWAAAVGLLVAGVRDVRRLSAVAAVAGATLCTLRPMGSLWCLLVAAVVLLAVRAQPGRVRLLLRRRDVQLSAAVIAVSAVQSAAWTMAMGALELGKVADPVQTSVAHRAGEVATLTPLWVLQSVAAFPMRDDATNPAVYLCFLLLFGAFMVIALRAADRRVRVGIAAVAAVSLVLPFVTSVSTYDELGAAWQGRYALPFAIGMAVLAGFALDRAGRTLPGPWPVLAGVLFVIAQVVSAASTLHVERARSPLVDSAAWVQPSMWLLVLVTGVGATLLWWGDAVPRLLARSSARA
jgi:hypothetical protein